MLECRYAGAVARDDTFAFPSGERFLSPFSPLCHSCCWESVENIRGSLSRRALSSAFILNSRYGSRVISRVIIISRSRPAYPYAYRSWDSHIVLLKSWRSWIADVIRNRIVTRARACEVRKFAFTGQSGPRNFFFLSYSYFRLVASSFWIKLNKYTGFYAPRCHISIYVIPRIHPYFIISCISRVNRGAQVQDHRWLKFLNMSPQHVAQYVVKRFLA